MIVMSFVTSTAATWFEFLLGSWVSLLNINVRLNQSVTQFIAMIVMNLVTPKAELLLSKLAS
jgi:hypothetical protein